jgi:L-malate glycosyltransferase
MGNKLRILFVIDQLEVGGTEGQLVEIIQRLDKEKFELFLCYLARSQSPLSDLLEQSGKVRTFVLNVRSTYSLRVLIAVYRLVQFIRSEKIDIVQGYFLKAKFLGMLAGKLGGKRTISCMRDLGMAINYKSLPPLKFANLCTDRFLVNSESIKNYLFEEQKINPEKIDVIMNGVDLIRFHPPAKEDKSKYKKALGIEPDHLVAGVVSNLKAEKGLDRFIRAAARVLKSIPNSRFVIVGKGPLEAELRHLAAGLGVQDKILFAGGQDDVRKCLFAFDIGVLCSVSEGFSNAILEYMATGLPVIATRVGGNTEQVQDGVTGLLVPPNDPESLANAITNLLEHEEVSSRMGRASFKYCQEHYGMDRMIENLENYYTSICAGKGSER